MFHINQYTLKQRLKDLQEGYKQYQTESHCHSVKRSKIRIYFKKWLCPLKSNNRMKWKSSNQKTKLSPIVRQSTQYP